ncbi:MAG: UDP-N-acetylglucosamine 2-epimerase (non-hydrolyzing) [Anaerolineae bacterium]|nr:UDP-N-acetylglucosamine 2-epimerase (non-hydrolyzing) [Anaerolineae bacterium]
MELFNINPDYQLDIMQPNQSLSASTSRLFSSLDTVLEAEKPHWVLAQGDTTTVMVSAITSYYQRLKFGHIEAGLRTYDKYSPFPEEGNRLIADVLADACFAPTAKARDRLIAEGIPTDRIILTGNTVVDAVLDISKRRYQSSIVDSLPADKRIVLVTAHRRESFGEPLRQLCYALSDIAKRFDDIHLIYPVHLNPQVQHPVYEILADVANISLIAPLAYPDLIAIMRRATLILTDSGGIQEEAPTFKVPLLVMRDTTERPEGIEAGKAKLVGTSRTRIVEEATAILTNPKLAQAMQGDNPYGDGQAAQRIVDYLLRASNG